MSTQDANGNPYPDNRLCITEACIHNTIESVDTNQSPAGFPVFLSLAVPYALPALIAIVGLIGLCASFYGSRTVCDMNDVTVSLWPDDMYDAHSAVRRHLCCACSTAFSSFSHGSSS